MQKYDAWVEEHAYAYQLEVMTVRSLLLPRSGRELEVGVGTGRFAVPLDITVGVEPSHAMASLAATRHRGLRGERRRAPFDNKSFDFVVMVTTYAFSPVPYKHFRK